MSQEEVFIHELLMGYGSMIMERKTLEGSKGFSLGEHVAKTFRHENEYERRNTSSFSYALGGVEGFRGDAIEKNGKEGSRDEMDHLANPRGMEPKG